MNNFLLLIHGLFSGSSWSVFHFNLFLSRTRTSCRNLIAA